MNLPKWRALLQPSRDWEHGVPRFPYNGASVFTHNCGQGQTTSASHAPSVCAGLFLSLRCPHEHECVLKAWR